MGYCSGRAAPSGYRQLCHLGWPRNTGDLLPDVPPPC